MNSIFHRTSIRQYQDKPVEQEKIEKMLRAAMAAPSACNQQPWEYYVVTNKTVLAQLADSSPYAGCTRFASLAFVACYRKELIAPDYADIRRKKNSRKTGMKRSGSTISGEITDFFHSA